MDVEVAVKLDPNNGRGGQKHIYQKISIEPRLENIYTQNFLYENYIYNNTERKIRESGAPPRPFCTSPVCGSNPASL
ncbi:hypothetical protein Hanom_Chr16g01438381 [Helianthus anomalus]